MSLSDDPDFVARLKRQDQAAWAALDEDQRPRINRLAKRMVGPGEAEDVTQEVLLTAANKIHTFNGSARLSTWLYRIAVNKCLELWRKQDSDATAWAALVKTIQSTGEPTPAPYDRDWIVLLQAALDQLDAESHEIVVLRYFEGLSYDGIANAMGFCKATIYKKMQRAEEQLIRLLSHLRWRLK